MPNSRSSSMRFVLLPSRPNISISLVVALVSITLSPIPLPLKRWDLSHFLLPLHSLPRPVFTCVVSMVQVGWFVTIAIDGGFTPISFTLQPGFARVIPLPTASLVRQKVCWTERENRWIGPRDADLIHYGALYPPCMRFDQRLQRTVIAKLRAADRA